MENINFKKKDNIFLTGHNGLVGNSIYKALIGNGYNNILIAEKKNIDFAS